MSLATYQTSVEAQETARQIYLSPVGEIEGTKLGLDEFQKRFLILYFSFFCPG